MTPHCLLERPHNIQKERNLEFKGRLPYDIMLQVRNGNEVL